MITLKQIVHYQDTNSVEATWVDEKRVVVRCHSYDQYQMEMFAADLGADLPQYQHIIDAVLAAQTPLPELEIEVPQKVTNYQGRVALDAFQLFDEVEAYMQLPDTPRQYKFAWATGDFERQGALLLGISALFNLTPEQIDQMFIYGAAVQ